MAEITREWLEEQVSLTWTSDVFEWYNNAKELIDAILNKQKESDNTINSNELHCVICGHPFTVHGPRGCNHNHDKPNWLVVGCTCSIRAIS